MTIYALSSGPGISGVAIIRISGSDASKAITLLTGKPLPSPRIASLRKINNVNTSELIDEGIIIWFPGPESYTGEDMAEIHVHGGKAIVLALQNELSKIENFRLAEPGEFTKIAFQNGKINLLKAESIADLISAETEIQRLQAVKTMKGKSAKKFDNLREKLLKILSFVEAKIDFPEEDLPDENIQARLRGMMVMAASNSESRFALATGNKSELAVGYCTLYGDMCGALAPIGDLFKMDVFAMARGDERIPKSIVSAPPSAELREDQRDDDSLPPYDRLDPILEALLVDRARPERLIAQGHDEDEVTRAVQLVDRSEFKRRQAAPVLRISKKSFGMGRRQPLAWKRGF